jgi:hypothetical protein
LRAVNEQAKTSPGIFIASLLSARIYLLVKSRARAPTISRCLFVLGEMCRNEVAEMVEMVSWSAKA